TADKQWSDWPVDPTFLLAMRSCATAAARGASHQDNVLAGQPIRIPLEPGQNALEPQVKNVNGEVAPAELVKGADKEPSVIRFGKTARAGAYEVTWKDATNKPQ